MGKIAFVCSGQGDQYPGMGKDWAEQYQTAASVYAMCDGIRPGTSEQCFTGTEETLKETKNTQPCLFATELAMASVLQEAGIRPDLAAGFSLGEVVAATIAGLVEPQTGFRLVCRRGELMQQEADRFDTAMAAVVKLTAEQVQDLCSRYTDLYPVNFNCPGQVTVSGLSERMPDFFADVREAGGRAIPLKVKGAFHSPFMQKAAEAFAEELAQAAFRPETIPLYANLTAKPYTEDKAGLLSKQICNPVQWEDSIRNMIAAGADTFIEIGPGQTLTRMIKKIDPTVTACTAKEYLQRWKETQKGSAADGGM